MTLSQRTALTVDDVWPLVQKLNALERRKLKRRLDQAAPAKDPWTAVDELARELGSLGLGADADTVTRWVREDRDSR